MLQMTQQNQRKYRYIEHTMSLCSQCSQKISAKIISQDNRIYLMKHCPTHGIHNELLEDDASYYIQRNIFDKPGTTSKTQTPYKEGCPFDCGLCPDHEQHTCIGVLEVTSYCSQECPVCYAGSNKNGKHLELSTIERMIDLYQSSESGHAEILQISGGEPTEHPQIIDIIKMARSKKIPFIMLNTNGVRISQDNQFVKDLKQFPPGFEVYLQFDGFDTGTYKTLRGSDIANNKLQAIQNLTEHKIPITLVVTIQNGVNDQEIGKIIQFAIDNKNIRGINFQPVTYFGRYPSDNKNRATRTGILNAIEKQSNGILLKNDFIPLPCDVERTSVAYMYRENGAITPLTRNAGVEEYLPIINNTLMFDAGALLKQSLESACCGNVCDCLSFLKDFKKLLPLGKNLSLESNKPRYKIENTFRISVTSFIDRYNFDIRSMQKECVHILTPDLRKIPFSAYNMLYRTMDATQ